VATPYTLKQLKDVEDSAKKFGFGEIQEVRFATEDLDAEDTGVSHHKIKAGMRQPFAHKHDKAEEIYVVLAGSGRAKLDDEIIELDTLDALRVAPGVTRAFEAGPSGIEIIVFGPHHVGDGEILQEWWTD
jgi:mannose-6-phosphate isomerase-like protein (cupin superfamily)